jgi:type VI secretion system protein ImpG
MVAFSNIRHPTVNVLPPLGGSLLWRLLSHLSLNYVSLTSADNLRAILGLYVFGETRDKAAVLANKKRIDGIEGVVSKASNRLVSGIMRSGREIRIRARQDHFSSPGDLYLFGSILDHFLSAYASINTFTRLVIDDVVKGDSYRWPERIGDHPLI